jgi:hypothetical protein
VNIDVAREKLEAFVAEWERDKAIIETEEDSQPLIATEPYFPQTLASASLESFTPRSFVHKPK